MKLALLTLGHKPVAVTVPADPSVETAKGEPTKTRVFALAEDLGVYSKDLIEACRAAGLSSKKSALASISPEETELLLRYLDERCDDRLLGGLEPKRVQPVPSCRSKWPGEVEETDTAIGLRPLRIGLIGYGFMGHGLMRRAFLRAAGYGMVAAGSLSSAHVVSMSTILESSYEATKSAYEAEAKALLIVGASAAEIREVLDEFHDLEKLALAVLRALHAQIVSLLARAFADSTARCQQPEKRTERWRGCSGCYKLGMTRKSDHFDVNWTISVGPTRSDHSDPGTKTHNPTRHTRNVCLAT